MLTIRIPGEPFAQPRHRSVPLMRDDKPVLREDGRPMVVEYDPKQARNWKAAAQAHMLEAQILQTAWASPPVRGEGVFTGPVEIRVLAVFTCPKSDHRKRNPIARRWHTKKPDADNVIKAVKDAAKGVLYLDDCQVCREICEKHIGAQGEAPYVEVTVRSLPDGNPQVFAIAMAAAVLGGTGLKEVGGATS